MKDVTVLPRTYIHGRCARTDVPGSLPYPPSQLVELHQKSMRFAYVDTSDGHLAWYVGVNGTIQELWESLQDLSGVASDTSDSDSDSPWSGSDSDSEGWAESVLPEEERLRLLSRDDGLVGSRYVSLLQNDAQREALKLRLMHDFRPGFAHM